MTRCKTQRAAVAGILSAAALLGCAAQAGAADITWERLLHADKDPNNWMMVHGSFKGWHYSALDQIDKYNVKHLSLAWAHTPTTSPGGIQSLPLVADGMLYYASAGGQVWALDAATGAPVWTVSAATEPAHGARTPRDPYSRGLAIGHGKVYFGTSDGRVVALNQKTGQLAWDRTILNAEAGNHGFTGAPLLVKDKLVIGANLDERYGCCGPLIALNAQTGQVEWQFGTLGADPRTPGAPAGEPAGESSREPSGESSGELGGESSRDLGRESGAELGRESGRESGGESVRGSAGESGRDSAGESDRESAGESAGKSGRESWKLGGGGRWMTGTFDPRTNSVWWATAHRAPGLDEAGENSSTDAARPHAGRYRASVVVLDADTGQLKAYFQEMRNDAWGFDGTVGEFVQIDRGGKRYMVHPNKAGAIFAYNADPAQAQGDQLLKLENAFLIGKTFNAAQGLDARSGALIGPRELAPGVHTNVCPATEGAISWNSGAYNPNNGLYYKATQEWCADIEVREAERPDAHPGSPFFTATWTVRHPAQRRAFGTLQAFDPIRGRKKWEVEFKYPPFASLLTTRGGLLFVPGADGALYALDADTGAKLWQHDNGLGHHGGAIAYSVKGRQYIAVVTGWGSRQSENYPPLFGEPFASMASDAGQLLVFAVK